MKSIILAALLNLAPGYNNVGAVGEVAAASAVTASNEASVGISSVDYYTTFSNIVEREIRRANAWAVTYTNFDGEAAISTNVVGRLDYEDFQTTNGVNKIIGTPRRFELVTTNEVVSARVPVETIAQTNAVATIATTNHFGSATIGSVYLLGSPLVVEGVDEGDAVKILIK